MKERKFKIKIQALSQTMDSFVEAFDKSNKGLPKKKNDSLSLCFENFKVLSKILSPERLKLLKVVRQDKPESINQLAKLLMRSQTNVHKDVHFLADLGILTLEKKKKGSKKEIICPKFEWDGFDIAV